MARRFNALDGVDEALRKLTVASVQVRDGLREVVRETTERAYHQARASAPVGRRSGGTTRDAVSRTYFDDGATGAVFVAPMRDPVTGARRAANLPIWLEYGTRTTAQRPFLTPAASEAASAFTAATVRVVTNAIKAAE